MSERIGNETCDERAVTRRLAQGDAEYPALLREIPDAPACLYARGELANADALAIAIVGSRQATPYGTAVAEDLSRELAARGVTVVSGLARGIDGAAHRGALRAGGRTIAVLGSGVDVIYPPEHRPLAREIEASGAVLSQFSPGTPPLAHHFPARNRVIAGLALGVVVVEATARSGALITARLAAELGREVMAVPGRVTSLQSRGTHALIRDGAALVECWEDIVAELPARWRDCLSLRPDAVARDSHGGGLGEEHDRDRRTLLDVVGEEPMTMDDVIEKTGLTSARAAALLLELELCGRIAQVEGRRFVQAGRD